MRKLRVRLRGRVPIPSSVESAGELSLRGPCEARVRGPARHPSPGVQATMDGLEVNSIHPHPSAARQASRALIDGADQWC